MHDVHRRKGRSPCSSLCSGGRSNGKCTDVRLSSVRARFCPASELSLKRRPSMLALSRGVLCRPYFLSAACNSCQSELAEKALNFYQAPCLCKSGPAAKRKQQDVNKCHSFFLYALVTQIAAESPDEKSALRLTLRGGGC